MGFFDDDDDDEPINEKLNAALRYANRGWHVFPCQWIEEKAVDDGATLLQCSCGNAKCKSPGKHPLTKNGFKDATTNEQTIKDWWAKWPNANVAIATGKISGIWVLDYDTDPDHWPKNSESYCVETPRPGRHFYYLSDDRIKPRSGGGIDCKTDGGYVLTPPSSHMLGTYRLLDDRDPVETPAEIIEKFGQKPASKPANVVPVTPQSDTIRRAIAYLDKVEPGIQGSGGSIPMFRAAGILVHGFDLDDDTAFTLLKTVYSPRCQPPWDNDKEIRHKIKSVRNKQWDRPPGFMLTNSGDDLDLSIFDNCQNGVTTKEDIEEIKAAAKRAAKAKVDHKLPPELMDCPGVVNELTNYILRTAIIPNKTLAFAASLAYQSFLCSRKVHSNRNCTALYIVALAGSGRGKDRPKEVIRRLLVETGQEDCLMGALRTYAGLDEALKTIPSIIATWDEFHRFLRGVVRDQSLESINLMDCMTELWSESRSIHVTRLLVGQAREIIYNPAVNLFATSIPKAFYESLGEYASENGFFYRLLVFDADSDSTERQRVPDEPLPARVLEAARHWKALDDKNGNLAGALPASTPPAMIEIPWSSSAMNLEQAEATKLDNECDGIAREVYSRTNEIAIRLATVRACSANHMAPAVTESDYKWGIEVAKFVASGMMMSLRARPRNQHDAICDRIIDAIKYAGGSMPFRDLSRKLHIDSKSLNAHLTTLLDREYIRRTGSPGHSGNLTYHLCDS